MLKRGGTPGVAGLVLLSVTLAGQGRLHKARPPEPGYSETDIWFRKIAEPVACRVEPRVLVFLTFDCTRSEPALARRFPSLAGVPVLFVAATRVPGVTRKRWVKQSFPPRRRGSGIKTLIWAELEAAGKMAGYHDLIVAATALERGSQVATFNRRHFDPVPGLTVVEPK